MATVAQGHEAGRLADEIDQLTTFRTNLQAIVTAGQSINQLTVGQSGATYQLFLPFNASETTHILNQLIADCTFLINQSTTALAAL